MTGDPDPQILSEFAQTEAYKATFDKYPTYKDLLKGLLLTPVHVKGEAVAQTIDAMCRTTSLDEGHKSTIVLNDYSAADEIYRALNDTPEYRKKYYGTFERRLSDLRKAREILIGAARRRGSRMHQEQLIVSALTYINQEEETYRGFFCNTGIISQLRRMEIYGREELEHEKFRAQRERSGCWRRAASCLEGIFMILKKKVSRDSIIALIQGAIQYAGYNEYPETEALRKSIRPRPRLVLPLEGRGSDVLAALDKALADPRTEYFTELPRSGGRLVPIPKLKEDGRHKRRRPKN
jgi:SHS2 domain-containing protein